MQALKQSSIFRSNSNNLSCVHQNGVAKIKVTYKCMIQQQININSSAILKLT